MTTSRRQFLKGAAATPLLLYAPKDDPEIFTFAKRKKIITSVAETDELLIGPDYIVSWSIEIDQNARTVPLKVGVLHDTEFVRLGGLEVYGTLSCFFQKLSNYRFVTEQQSVRVQLPKQDDMFIPEFRAQFVKSSITSDGARWDMVADLEFIMLAPYPDPMWVKT